ncbi:hypothetical protein CONLIGDRAFT_651494 [Coniochaeta ligniaria NRRL 30616]|uniref:Uncharacterized protein n=1 Tax=Coniochaeta ligniaria NRRL 30616 TaxID=1408157 RepID=A0A1J7K5G6_9PEZI|nr:hypothetical protein CONLIGDRAFT_651494 [Coniochaeta ligniaria NRRL 30616]
MAATEVQMDPRSSHRHGPSQTYAHLPASPTLTNPDMILPDYDRSVSPGMELDDDRNHSPLMMWKNAHTAGPDLSQIFGNGMDQHQTNHPYGPTGPMTPTTPIIYGNGTMLSDIGEVTEVESTPGKPSPGRIRKFALQQSPTRGSGSDAALRSSPTIGVEHTLKKRSGKNLAAHRERRDSADSTSTITTQARTDLFADFDDSVSVDDSVFQGDDEESVAESYVEQAAPPESTARLGVPQSDNLDRLSITSSTSLSRRAEEILANAKRKLTTMEGNLTRARSSLHVSTPSRSSLGSLGSDSTPSPPFKRASTATYIRDVDLSSPTSPRHSLLSSDNTTDPAPAPRIGTQRSASALGVSGGYRRPLTASRSEDYIRNSLDGQTVQRTSSLLRDHHGLAPLTEDAADSNGQLSEDGSNSAKLNRFLSPTFGSFSDNGGSNGRPIQRSASVAQMRDIKDQMKDLKGRLSNLREQARSDSMKRRSLQSLRTPSPFTHAQVDQWYAEPKTSRLSSEIGSGNGSVGRSPWNGDVETANDKEPVAVSELKELSGEEEESVYSEIENNTQLRPPGTHSPERKPAEAAPETEVVEMEDEDDGISDMHTENGDFEDEVPVNTEPLDEEAYYSESGESLYQDALQHPISHEDREDAFDYEHFFLHSAMGTISQQRLGRRGSRDSFTSEDSVVTTRAITEAAKDDSEATRSGSSEASVRRNSDASISTVGTFATATEGSGSPMEFEGRAKEFTSQGVPVSSRSRPSSAESVRRITFAAGNDHSSRPSTAITRHSIASFTSIPEEDGKENEDPYANFNPRVSVNRRPMSSSATASLHRPSVSSMESTGTTRSFPLVNRAKKANSIGVLTPQNSSPDHELKALSDSLLNETASVCEQQQQERENPHDVKPNGISRSASSTANGSPIKMSTPQAMQVLLREDQYLVERLVANLGRCVLGLTESGKASAESRMYRRRIDAARRILEGLDQV